MVRHVRVNFAGEFDEARAEIPLFGLPRKVERIDRDAVSAEAWSGIERMEAERLGGCSFDDFPDIDAHTKRQQFQFVDQCDVDTAVDVFEKLRHLRSSW